MIHNKREYNSERRRKLNTIKFKEIYLNSIRENITPRGDGNDKATMDD